MSTLRSHRGQLTLSTDRAAYDSLMEDVLGLASPDPSDQAWMPFAFFDSCARCAAGVEAAILPLVADGSRVSATGIRSVAVAPSWRGHGLFRALMADVLAWSNSRANGPALLFTETPELYGRFGFQLLPQHAFVGQAPPPSAAEAVRPLDPWQDRALIVKLVDGRAPTSLHATLEVGSQLYMANLAKPGAPSIAFLPAREVLIAYEDEGDTLVIADVVGPEIPPLPILLGALGRQPRRVKTLFSPDRLMWRGDPVSEDTGLMARGPLPAALTRSFMFPPTVEF